MNVTDFVTCQKIILALLDAGPDDFSFSVNVGDEQYGAIGAASDQVKEAIFGADEQVYLAIAETLGHWARPDLMDWSALLDHLVELPMHIGATGDVQILPWVASSYVAGKPATVEEIEQWRSNDNNAFGSLAHNASGNSLGGYYCIRDDVFHLTGYRGAIQIVSPYTRSASLCQSPSLYQNAVWAGAAATMFAKQLNGLAKATFLAGEFRRMLAEIRGNLQAAPALEQFAEVKG